MNSKTQDNILVIKLGALGDFIQALGPMAAIRKHHPDANITLLTTKPFESLAKKSNYFDEIWLDDKPKIHQISLWRQLKARFNDGDFNRVYDLQNNDRTSFYFKLFKPKPEWVGVARGASHRNKSKERTKGQAFDGHKMTLELAGINNVEIDTLSWMEADLNSFNLQDKYAVIVAGSAPQHPYKRWPAAQYAALCNDLASMHIQPVLLGTDDEKETTSVIAEQCPDALDLTGKTKLHDIPALARNAVISVGNDTGPMHLIAPTGCPSVILFSEHSNPVRHAPKGKNVKTLQVNDLNDLSIDMARAAIAQYLPAQ